MLNQGAEQIVQGSILWNFNPGGSVIDGQSIVKGFVLGIWLQHIAPGSGNKKVYAFAIPGTTSYIFVTDFRCWT